MRSWRHRWHKMRPSDGPGRAHAVPTSLSLQGQWSSARRTSGPPRRSQRFPRALAVAHSPWQLPLSPPHGMTRRRAQGTEHVRAPECSRLGTAGMFTGERSSRRAHQVGAPRRSRIALDEFEAAILERAALGESCLARCRGNLAVATRTRLRRRRCSMGALLQAAFHAFERASSA